MSNERHLECNEERRPPKIIYNNFEAHHEPNTVVSGNVLIDQIALFFDQYSIYHTMDVEEVLYTLNAILDTDNIEAMKRFIDLVEFVSGEYERKSLVGAVAIRPDFVRPYDK